MKVLIVGKYKSQYNDVSPFVREQAEALQQQGCVVEYFYIKGTGLSAYFKSYTDLRKRISEFHPDIIHAHYGLSGITAVLQRKVPVVTTFHNGETLNIFVNLLSSLFSLRAAYVIYVARHIYDLVVFKSKERCVIMPCGIDLNECEITDYEQARCELGFETDKKYILFGGAFDNLRKNYPLLKEAVNLLKRDDIEILEMKGLTRKQISKIMSAADLFALPSKSEGSPQALKEAMACNCPIIATDVADISWLLGDVDGHYLCSFDPIEVAEKLTSALNFAKRTNGRKRIIALGLDNRHIAMKLIDIYNKVCKHA